MLQCTRMVPLRVISIPMHWGSLSLLRSRAMFVGSFYLSIYIYKTIFTMDISTTLTTHYIHHIYIFTTFNIVVIGSELHNM